MSIDESLAKRKLEQTALFPEPVVQPNGADNSQLIKDVENAVYAQHQRLINEFKDEAKRSEAEMINRLNEWETAFNRNQEAWAAESRVLAEKTLKAALATAQDSATGIIRKEVGDCIFEMRKTLHELGFVDPIMDPNNSPQFLGDNGKRWSWKTHILPWLSWIAAIVAIVVMVLIIQNVVKLHLLG
jgi:hypothetical protein